MARPQPSYKPGDYIADRYQVHEVQMGGMGEVYLTIDIALSEPVAIKTYQTRYIANKSKLNEAFISEARTWVMLERHLNIVQAKSVFVLDQQPFIVVEWIAGDETIGTDLRSWLRRGSLDISLALDFALQFCHGATYAHRKLGLIHRDIKPENILITRDRVLKITDFGLARVDSDIQKFRDGMRGGIVGTPVYMAPEQWLGSEITIQTDIYALGCTLFEMITGRPVFEVTFRDGSAKNHLDMLRKAHLESPPPNLKTLNPAIPDDLSVIVLKCLKKNPIQRFFYYEDLIEQLQRVYYDYTGKEYKPPNEGQQETPNSEAQLLNSGDSLFTLGRYSEALNYYDQLLDLNPQSAIFWQRKAETLMRMDKWHEALIYFNEATTLDTDNLRAVKGKTKCLIKMTRYEDALTCCSPILALNPDDKELLQLKRELLTIVSDSPTTQLSSEQHGDIQEAETPDSGPNSTSPISPLPIDKDVADLIETLSEIRTSSIQQFRESPSDLPSPTKIPHLEDIATDRQERFDELFQELVTRLQVQGIRLEISESAKRLICKSEQRDLSFEQIFEQFIEVPLTDNLLSAEFRAGDWIQIDEKFGDTAFEKIGDI